MLVFIVTVKDHSISRDGDRYGQLLQRCLKSILAQTDSRFEIVLVGGDLPPGVSLPADRCHFSKLDIPAPEASRVAMNRDKTRKQIAGTEIGKALAPDYYMMVDSDDCVHRDAVKFVHNVPLQKGGWYVKQGYVYKEGSNWAWLNKDTFNHVCGSSIIIRPNKVESLFSDFIKKGIPLYSFNSPTLPCETELAPVPFPAMLYSVMNGENIHLNSDKVSDLRQQESTLKFYVRKAMKYRPVYVSKSFKRIFSLSSIEPMRQLRRKSEARARNL